jgi:hypothetical protein
VRGRLVAVGIGLLVLTIGAFVSLYLPLGPGPSTTVHTFTSLPAFAPARTAGSSPAIAVTNVGSASLHLTWKSTVPLNVSLGTSPPCGGGLPCPPPAHAPLVSWQGVLTGDWNYSGTVSGPLYLQWYNPGGSGGSISFTLRETVIQGSSYSSITSLLVDASLLVLSAIGAIAVFLGLFLRSGVYRGPAPLVSHGPDDAEEVAHQGPTGPTGPRTGPSVGGSEGPPRTPAAPPGRGPLP